MGLCSITLVHAFVIAISSVLIGNTVAYTSPTGQKIRDEHHISPEDFKWSFYSSIVFLGAMAGPFVTKFLLKKFNGKRKNTIFVIGVINTCGWLFNCLVKVNIYLGMIARAILGISIGSFSSVSTKYLTEIAPKEYAGFYGSLNTIFIFIAEVILSFLGSFIDYMGFNYFSAAIGVAFCILIWFVKESPVISSSTLLENEEKEPLFQKKNVRGLCIGIAIMFFQQFSGANGILTGLSDIFRNAGLNFDPNYQSGIALMFLLVANILCSFMIDKLGHRVQWIISTLITFLGCLLMGLNEIFNWSNYLSLISIFIFNIGFGLGMGSIPWFLVFTLFDDQNRESGNTICVLSNWFFSFLIVMIFPTMLQYMKMSGSMIFFAIICLISAFFGGYFIKPVSDKVVEDLSDNEEEDLYN